jgi:23S rRNA (uracil1939-C5)-methyltransferase
VSADVAPSFAIAPASRRRATFAFRRDEGAFGFHARKSARVIALEECPVLDPALAARVGALGALAAALPGRAFDLSATLCDNGLDIDAQGAGAIAGPALQRAAEAMRKAGVVRLSVDGAPAITLEPPRLELGGVPVRPPPGAFLQASRAGEAALIARVKDALNGAKRIVDLFAGAGTFALPLAQSASLSAFDADRAAIEALKAAAADAQRAGLAIHPLKAEARDLFERPLSVKELKAFDAAVIDPPRAGAKAQSEALAQSAIRRLAYVSCNPASFARDAAILIKGGFTLAHVEPVDQFAFSPHIELVGMFRR